MIPVTHLPGTVPLVADIGQVAMIPVTHHPGTVDENVISAPKMRNKFWYPIKIYIYFNIDHVFLRIFFLC